MRIIHIYSGRIHKTGLHFDFIRKLAERDDCDFYLYSPRDITVSKKENYINDYNKLTATDLVNEYNPDIFLLNMKECTDGFLPSGFSKIKNIPKIMIEVDYWEHKKEKFWYEDNIDLLIQRAFYKYSEQPNIKSVWLPFSADETRFKNLNLERNNKIMFSGSFSAKIYSVRRDAIKTLSNAGILTNFKYKWEDSYIEAINLFVGMLSCSCDYIHSIPCKVFESMACGTAMLTTYFHNYKELFGEKCHFEYKDDCSDIVNVANNIINNKAKTKEIVTRAYDTVHKYHLHKHRLNELYNIINTFCNTGEVIKRWDH